MLRWLNFNINYRNHRKIVVIDGKTSYVGGFNIGDEYLGKDPKLGPWRDTHLRIEGPASLALQLRFLLDWNFASPARLEPSPKYFPTVAGDQGAIVQIVSSGPMRRQDQIKEAYLKMVASANRSILIQTPYFIPDQSVMDLLRIAALSGVEVKIMVPQRRDQLLVHWASDSYLGELLEVGVRVFYYQKGFIHSKTITVDESLVSIGSANWDIRSFELNFETNAVVFDRAVGEEHARLFNIDQESCTELTKEAYDRRGLGPRVKVSLSRLASPVL
jgi:cardiolipin synthase